MQSSSQSTADSDSQFPALLAGLVSTSDAVERDSGAMPSGVVPRPDLDTAAGARTLLGGKHAAWHGDAVSPSVVAATASGKHSSEHKTASGHAGSTEQSDAASKLGAPAAKAPGPERPAVVQPICTLPMRPTDAVVVPGPNLPVPMDTVALSGGDGEPANESPVAVAGKTPLVELEAVPELPGVAAGMAHEAKGPATLASLRAAPAAGRQSRQETAGVAPQQSGELRFPFVRAASGEEAPSGHAASMAATQAMPVAEMPQAPALPRAAERTVLQSGGRAVASSSDAPATIGTGDLPTDGYEQVPLVTAPVAVLDPAGLGARSDVGPTGSATDAANALRPPLELVKTSPAPMPHPRSADAGVVGAEDEMVVPVERPSTGTEATDSGRHTDNGPYEQPTRRSSGSVVAQVLALSGQVPRTLDSIPSARSPKVAPASLAENPAADANPQVRAVPASTPDRGEVAFAMQMQAIPAHEDTVPVGSQGRMPAVEESRRIPIPTAEHEVPVVEPVAASENRPSLSGEPDQSPARAGRGRHPEDASPERAEAPTGIAAGKVIPHTAQDAQLRTGTAPERPEAAAAKPVRPQDAMEGESKPEAPSAPALRDMKFEVTGGESRVEVRLSERGGEVKMTVRTPDASLASTLRDNLPALSTRLAESGFKSEFWHPATSSTNEWRHTAQSSAGGAFQDANSQPREQNRESQDGAGQRRPGFPRNP